MKTFLIFTTGRTGSDYLNSCLDNVKNVMTFCGYFVYYEFFRSNNELILTKKLLDDFFKKYKEIFSHNKVENIDTKINIQKLKYNFLKIYKRKYINRKDFLKNIYLAYHITLGRKLTNKTVLIHHTHNKEHTEEFLKDFPNSKIFVTIRDPRDNLRSGIYNWFKFDPKNLIQMSHVFFYIRRIREDLNYILKKKNKKLFIKLEEANLKTTKKKIFKFLNLEFDRNIYQSTLASKNWKGDIISRGNLISQRYYRSGRINKSIDLEKWKKEFTHYEIKVFSLLYYKYNKFGYKIKKIIFKEKIKILLLCFLPYSFEKIVFKQKNLSLKRYLKNYFFYVRRVLYLINVIMFNKN